MAIEVEFFTITGQIGPSNNDLLLLHHAPSTGPDGNWDIALDPTDGPAQRLGIDFGVTHLDASGCTGAVSLDLANSDIKYVMNNTAAHGVTGPLTMRVVYNYETGMCP
ncbi:MAG: hypothetical protein GF334_13295 [Candidatus Altiarchaeales archaeon]|nr:hypothetical protein [Candidatus Altiarchaeales archaeon]